MNIDVGKLSRQYDKIGANYIRQTAKYYEHMSNEATNFIRGILSIEATKRGLSKEVGYKKPILLDVGCGNCDDAIRYRDFGFEVYGLDSSWEMLKCAQRLPEPPKKLIHSSMDDIPLKGESVDVLTGRYTLHYLENVDKAYEEFGRVLRPNGLIVMIVGHPINSLLRQRKKVYGHKEVIGVPLYNETVIVRSVSHTLRDYLSPVFLKNFDLLEIREGRQRNEKEFEGLVTPGFLGFAGRKR